MHLLPLSLCLFFSLYTAASARRQTQGDIRFFILDATLSTSTFQGADRNAQNAACDSVTNTGAVWVMNENKSGVSAQNPYTPLIVRGWDTSGLPAGAKLLDGHPDERWDSVLRIGMRFRSFCPDSVSVLTRRMTFLGKDGPARRPNDWQMDYAPCCKYNATLECTTWYSTADDIDDFDCARYAEQPCLCNCTDYGCLGNFPTPYTSYLEEGFDSGYSWPSDPSPDYNYSLSESYADELRRSDVGVSFQLEAYTTGQECELHIECVQLKGWFEIPSASASSSSSSPPSSSSPSSSSSSATLLSSTSTPRSGPGAVDASSGGGASDGSTTGLIIVAVFGAVCLLVSAVVVVVVVVVRRRRKSGSGARLPESNDGDVHLVLQTQPTSGNNSPEGAYATLPAGHGHGDGSPQYSSLPGSTSSLGGGEYGMMPVSLSGSGSEPSYAGTSSAAGSRMSTPGSAYGVMPVGSPDLSEYGGVGGKGPR
jgi:hypothetical protein